MTLLAVERIKLFSTRSPWWCMALALALPITFSVMIAINSTTKYPATVSITQAGYQFGMIVVMVMAALAVTNEYRFGTIKATFQAVPSRTSALVAKTAVVTVLAGVLGELAAFAAWGSAKLIKPGFDLAINTEQEWRNVAGVGLVFAAAAILAVGVGILLRQTAAAVALLLVYSLLIESLITLIPKIGEDIHKWLPFQMADNFLNAGRVSMSYGPPPTTDAPIGAWWSLAYFAGIALVVLIAGLVVAKRRDA